jgi:hypothetical protein
VRAVAVVVGVPLQDQLAGEACTTRFYQRRGFRLAALRAGAVDEARKRLKPRISSVGGFGIPIRDEIELEVRPIETSSSRE